MRTDKHDFRPATTTNIEHILRNVFLRFSHFVLYTSSAHRLIRLCIEFKRYEVTRRLFFLHSVQKTIFNLVRIHASHAANVHRLAVVTENADKIEEMCEEKRHKILRVFLATI